MKNFEAQFLNHEEILKITQAVVLAESHTEGEIVPMIVSRSSAVGHLPYECAMILFSLSLVLMIFLQPWWFLAWKIWVTLGFFITSMLLGLALSRLDFIRRWLIPAHDQEAQVWQRARSEWATSKVQKTQNRTGILIFVSVLERKALVLADEGVSRFYPTSIWQEVIDALSEHLKKGEWVQGFEKAISRCGEILQKHLPAQNHAKNEISNEPVIKS